MGLLQISDAKSLTLGVSADRRSQNFIHSGYEDIASANTHKTILSHTVLLKWQRRSEISGFIHSGYEDNSHVPSCIIWQVQPKSTNESNYVSLLLLVTVELNNTQHSDTDKYIE